MMNGLRPYCNRIMTGGMASIIESLAFSNSELEAVLVGQIVVTPYKEVLIRV